MNIPSAQKGFLTFLVIKFLIVLAATLFYYFKRSSISAIFVQHLVIAFLSIDFLFVIYLAANSVFPGLPNYFFSGTDQLLGHYIFGLPKFLVSFIWSLVFIFLALKVLDFEFKKLGLLIVISGFSFLLFSNGLIYFMRLWYFVFLA